MVFIQTQAETDTRRFTDIFPKYDMFFKWYGYEASVLLRAAGVVHPGDVEKTQDTVLKEAEALAKRLLG